MTADNLESLSDGELSEAFAVELAGWARNVVTGKLDGHPWMKSRPNYADDSKYVLPFLTDHGYRAAGSRHTHHTVTLHLPCGELVEVNAPTFARSACIALILAKRKEAKKS